MNDNEIRKIINGEKRPATFREIFDAIMKTADKLDDVFDKVGKARNELETVIRDMTVEKINDFPNFAKIMRAYCLLCEVCKDE